VAIAYAYAMDNVRHANEEGAAATETTRKPPRPGAHTIDPVLPVLDLTHLLQYSRTSDA
jgi:hypothetical protein